MNQQRDIGSQAKLEITSRHVLAPTPTTTCLAMLHGPLAPGA